MVYDLDQTLVRLAVDWGAARDAVAEVFREAGRDPGEASLWRLLDEAEAVGGGLADRVEAVLADYERAGAETARRLPTADEVSVVAADRPVGVLSLNAEAACRVALERHDLTGHVACVVGRDSVQERKPHPAPLLTVLDRLDVALDRALFVGDSRRDAECAERAGVDFAFVGDDSSDH